MANNSVVAVAVGDDDDDYGTIVTEFLLHTCGVLHRSKHHVQGAWLCSDCVTAYSHGDYNELVGVRVDNEINVPLVTGSSSEFYIQPMLSCVSDVDVMFHRSDELAIPESHPPPTELPAQFYSRVRVYEVMDSKYPGYVYLVLSYLLTENTDTGKYDALLIDKTRSVSFVSHGCSKTFLTTHIINGPALTILGKEHILSYDRVYCVRCLSWPLQATDWPKRYRNYGWPDSATVGRVVSNGCDLVGVAHRQCVQDEILWMSMHQWRLSFSRAEVVLLNSWILVQQIVYHILRFFYKTERLTDIISNTETKIFSNYHFKTLMMWACELRPQSWWIDDMNVVRICVRLLHVLADCLRNNICRHYFVNDCNLIYSRPTEQLAIMASHLVKITESWLSTWFVNSYLRKCAHLCPDRVLRLFYDVSTRTKLHKAVSAIVDSRPNHALLDLWKVSGLAEYSLSTSIYMYSLTVRSCSYWIMELVKIDSCCLYYFTAVALLHIAKMVAKCSLTDDLLDAFVTVIGLFVGKGRYCHQLSNKLSLSQAVILMKVAVNNSHSTLQQIQYELSKSYLYRALKRKDSDKDSIYCLANVYLAVLCYTSGRYQMAIDHCTLVMRSQDHSRCSSRVVQGEILPKIDDNIDTVLGLAVFYQYVRTAALNQQQTQYVSVFTTELFACCLYTTCLSVINLTFRQFTQMQSICEARHTKFVVEKNQLFVADILLTKMSQLSCHYKPLSDQRQKSPVKTELVELLQQSAVEHLTTFRQLEARRFGSVATIATTDFEALYAYKRGDYQRCLQQLLSRHNVCRLLYHVHAPSIFTYPEFIQLMDDDITSLCALVLIHLFVFYPHAELQKTGINSNNFIISQMTWSVYQMTQCRLKLRHSVTSLAETLNIIAVAQRRCPPDWTLDILTLKLIKCKLMTSLSMIKKY